MELKRESGGAIGLIFGSAIGMILGVMWNDMYLWMAMGGALGLIFGSCLVPKARMIRTDEGSSVVNRRS